MMMISGSRLSIRGFWSIMFIGWRVCNSLEDRDRLWMVPMATWTTSKCNSNYIDNHIVIQFKASI